MALGVTGSHTLSETGTVSGIGTTSSWGLDMGAIFNPHGQSRVGITAFDVLDGVDAFGVGYSYDPTPWATLALDGIYSLQGNNAFMVKPGIGLHIMGFQMAVGYGIQVQSGASDWIPQGASLALGFPVGHGFAIQAYYNQLALYYAGLSVSL